MASGSITITFDDGSEVTEDDIPLDILWDLYDWLVYEGIEFDFEVFS
jgi:hypothetical protein